jgi:hypothetical protein
MASVESKETKKKKGREAAIAWLRDTPTTTPSSVQLFQDVYDLIAEIVMDETTNAAETTPHLREAIVVLIKMHEPNKRKGDGCFGKSIFLLGLYEFRMHSKQ